MIEALERGKYYVQIGVYGTSDTLKAAIARVSAQYPMALQRMTTKGGAVAYRLYVGPLQRDESGLLLLRIKALGYKDAYIKSGS
jgi:Sporulation related domain.